MLEKHERDQEGVEAMAAEGEGERADKAEDGGDSDEYEEDPDLAAAIALSMATEADPDLAAADVTGGVAPQGPPGLHRQHGSRD